MFFVVYSIISQRGDFVTKQPTNKLFTLENLLRSFHGIINIIELSYITRDTPTGKAEYEKWYEESNKSFKVDLDLFHTNQKLNDFEQLKPYLPLEIISFSILGNNGITTLEVDLK